jgi:hypothetical protein
MSSFFLWRRTRGSLLIVALVFSAAIALVLTTYLRLSVTALRLSERALCENSAMNLTECGIELAISAINANAWPAPWTVSGGDATATFTGFVLSQHVTGSVKVYVQNYASTSPLIVAKGIATLASGAPVKKWVEVSGFVPRSYFPKGLIGRTGVSFGGSNTVVDSWNSNPTNAAIGTYVPTPYSPLVAQDHGTIAALNVAATDAVGNAQIYGTASVGSASSSAVVIGSNGLVGPFGTLPGTTVPANISTNFTLNLPVVNSPTPPSAPYAMGSISATTTLPRLTDVPASDGKYYYVMSNVNLASGATLTIAAGKNVVFLPTAAPGNPAISTSGGSSITVQAGGSLNIYTHADVSLTGGSIVNGGGSGSAAAFQIWGTNNTGQHPGQSITIGGNSALCCTCFAPNGDVKVAGGAGLYGAFVGWAVTVTGGGTFHYDEALAQVSTTPTFAPTKWRELLTITDRNVYAGSLGN